MEGGQCWPTSPVFWHRRAALEPTLAGPHKCQIWADLGLRDDHQPLASGSWTDGCEIIQRGNLRHYSEPRVVITLWPLQPCRDSEGNVGEGREGNWRKHEEIKNIKGAVIEKMVFLNVGGRSLKNERQVQECFLVTQLQQIEKLHARLHSDYITNCRI